MEVEVLRFGNPCRQIGVAVARRSLVDRNLLHTTIDLVSGREEHDRRRGRGASTFQNIQRSQRIGFEVTPRIGYRGRHGNLPRQMVDNIMVADCRCNGGGIAYIGFNEAERGAVALLQPAEILLGTWS